MSPPYRYLIIFELIYQRAPERSVEHPRAFEDWSISVTVVAVVLPVVLPMENTPPFPLKEPPCFECCCGPSRRR